MKFLKFITSFLLIYEIPFYLIKGQTITKEKTDCTNLNNFLNNDSKYYDNSCCSDGDIECDNEGYITSLSILPSIDRNSWNSNSKFPYFSKIEKFEILMTLVEIPNEILQLTTLKILNLFNNQIGLIPSSIQNLSNLEELDLSINKIKNLPNEIFNLKNLKILDLSDNNIEEISPAIQNLSQLEELYLDFNDIRELPNKLFNLENLKLLSLDDNPNLNVKMINFGNSIINKCYFNNINILCYEPHTCKSIYFNNTEISDAEVQNYFKICTQDEINEILNQNDEKSNLTFPIIIGSVVIVFIGVFAIFMFIKKIRYKNHVKLVSSFNNGINNNNNDNKIDYGINNSNITQNNLNRNKNIMVNLNDMMKDVYKDESYSFSYSLSPFSKTLSSSYTNSLSPSFSNSFSPLFSKSLSPSFS